MKRLLLLLLILLLLAASSLGSLFLYARRDFVTAGPLSAEATLIIPPGTAFGRISADLAEQGVIRHPRLFQGMVYWRSEQGKFKAGEYRFTPGIAPNEVAAMLVAGKVVVHDVTIPEGLGSKDAAAILVAEPLLKGDIATPPEGSLLPETYQFLRDGTKQAVLARARAAQKTLLERLWKTKRADLPYPSSREALILASIVEKETGAASERPRIATVFLNRLARGMPLQSDPTVVYGRDGIIRPGGAGLTKADLAAPSPYNTYLIPGLPPGPICNPGRAAIEAVFAPAASDELYFVADGAGGHRFAATLEGHNRNVALYRAVRQAAPSY